MKFVFFVVFLTLGLAYYSVAHAQESTQIVVGDLVAPWLEMLVGAVSILITAILGWLAAQLKMKTGIDIEARHREALQTALTNAAGLALSKLGDTAKDTKIDVRSPIIRDSILYVNKAVPDAVKNFGLSPDQLAEKLVAKIGLALAPSKVEDPIKASQ